MTRVTRVRCGAKGYEVLQWTQTSPQIVIHLVGALVAGGVIGLERSFHGRPAGFRTHALVCLASSLLMLVTLYQWKWLPGVSLDTVRTDPTRMAQGIMTGIGFLGAGVIFKEGLSVRGLTTAASIWITAAIGKYRMVIRTIKPENLSNLAVALRQHENVRAFRISPTGD